MPSLLRIAVPALAAASTAYAACSASATQTIENGGDATAIASCSTFSGSIAVATGVSDDLDFGSLSKIDGDFTVDGNHNIQRISGSGLETISGTLKLNDVPQLAGLSFPKLNEVKEITLTGLANLRSLGFDNGVSKADKVDIENTQLQNLDGLNLNETDNVLVANNLAIDAISMNVTNITVLILSNNNAEVNVSFPSLKGAGNITCIACGSIDLSSLEELETGLSIKEGKLESFIAPKLSKVNGALVISNNTALSNVSLPALTDVGRDLRISNNTKLDEIKGLPKLKNVGAALDMSGNLTEVETPTLDYVKGVFNLQSTTDLGDSCKFYDDLQSKGKIPKSKYVCEGKLKEAGTAGSKPQGGDDKKGAASPLNVQIFYLGLAGLAAVLFV